MRRRDFITTLAGAAAAWPSAAVTQVQGPPVVGFLGPQSPSQQLLANFHRGLNEAGFIEGRNVVMEYRWALNQKRGLPDLAAELVRRRVALIVTAGGLVAAKAAREATTTIPILFVGVGLDPVENGFVASFNRPGGNVTGLSLLTAELLSKRLELLRQLAANAGKIAFLFNDDDSGLGPNEKAQIDADRRIAKELGLFTYFARSENEIEAAFPSMAQQQIDALLVASDPLFSQQRTRIVALAARYMFPAGYSRREFTDAGGLMSYGPSRAESWREAGHYAGRILNGARPEDLPVRLEDKYELVVNMTTARSLGLKVPPLLHALADETIE